MLEYHWELSYLIDVFSNSLWPISFIFPDPSALDGSLFSSCILFTRLGDMEHILTFLEC